MSRPTRVLMVGLDAAELDVIERLMQAGRMPTLAALTRRGCRGVLASPAAHYAGAVWPCFYTGMAVPWHGIYHNKLWRGTHMRCEVPRTDWLGARAFWEQLDAAGRRCCIVDVPMLLGEPRLARGTYVGGWGTHDLVARSCWPPELWRSLVRRHGAPAMPRERYGRQDGAALLRLRDALLASTSQLRGIATNLLDAAPWDLACVVFGAAHRAGHYLWDLTQLPERERDGPIAEQIEGALETVYEAVDAALGNVLDQAGEDTLVFAFAVHGMGPNPGWSDLATAMLESVERDRDTRGPKTGLLYALKRRVPFHWVRPLLTRLPAAINDRLVAAWSARMYDWTCSRYLPLPMDHAGFLRVNLRGRERDGIIDAGEPYEAVCDELEALVRDWRDADSGAPIVRNVHRAYAQTPATAPYRDLIPDLIVTWGDVPATRCHRVTSMRNPGFVFPVPALLPSGRSGNHTGRGWFVAAGPGVAAGREVAGHSILDLAPTVLRALDMEPDTGLQGRAIDLA